MTYKGWYAIKHNQTNNLYTIIRFQVIIPFSYAFISIHLTMFLVFRSNAIILYNLSFQVLIRLVGLCH